MDKPRRESALIIVSVNARALAERHHRLRAQTAPDSWKPTSRRDGEQTEPAVRVMARKRRNGANLPSTG
jgi:hypothetical protein